MKEEVIEGSGNVFADLGLPNPEARLAKAGLVLQIHRTIRERSLTQVEAAELTRMTQPKISDLLRGKTTGFSTDRLLRILNALDQDVEIRVRTRPKGLARQALISVVAEL